MAPAHVSNLEEVVYFCLITDHFLAAALSLAAALVSIALCFLVTNFLDLFLQCLLPSVVTSFPLIYLNPIWRGRARLDTRGTRCKEQADGEAKFSVHI